MSVSIAQRPLTRTSDGLEFRVSGQNCSGELEVLKDQWKLSEY